MKKNLLFILVIFLSYSLQAQDVRFSKKETEFYTHLICDISLNAYVKNFSLPFDYWQFVKNENAGLKKYEKSKSRLKSKVLDELSNYKLQSNIIDKYCYSTSFNDKLDSLSNFLKGAIWGNENLNNNIFFIEGGINSFTNANGNFYIEDGLRKILDKEELIFVMAHEYVHFLMKHIEVGIYSGYKRKIKNEIIGGTASALALAGAGYAAAQVSPLYSDEVIEDGIQLSENISSVVNLYTELYAYRYSREQEYEADYLAFCFMKSFENIDKAISALEKIYVAEGMKDNDTDIYSDHPSLFSRIKFFYFLKQWNGEINESKGDDLYYMPY